MKRTLLTCLIATTAMIGLYTSCSSELDEDFDDYLATGSRAEVGLPRLTDVTIDLTSKTATYHSQALDLGEYTVRNYGFLVSTTEKEPPMQLSKGSTRKICTTMDEDGSFEFVHNDVLRDTTYYVRSFMRIKTPENTTDTIYSAVSTFRIQKVLPKLETMTVVNRARRGACVFARFLDSGNAGLSKWGVCISESPLPTPANCLDVQFSVDTCKHNGYLGEFGAFFEVLEPKTLYHTRAFAITTDQDTIYGEDRIFRTSIGGNYAWEWGANEDGARSAGAHGRIVEAMDSASYYYNNYSNLYLRAHVEYNAGVQTADCSYGGWIRFGANSRYQWVGTAQHETSHGLGVGTCWNWRSLINYDGNRQWTGKCANRTLRAVMNDQTLWIKGDNQHFWPGGINQREEVTNGTANSYGVYVKNERMLRCNAMILNGMQIDGLDCP